MIVNFLYCLRFIHRQAQHGVLLALSSLRVRRTDSLAVSNFTAQTQMFGEYGTSNASKPNHVVHGDQLSLEMVNTGNTKRQRWKVVRCRPILKEKEKHSVIVKQRTTQNPVSECFMQLWRLTARRCIRHNALSIITSRPKDPSSQRERERAIGFQQLPATS